MASRYIAKKKLLTAQSLGAAFFSPETKVENLTGIAWKVACVGVSDNVGTFYFQVRDLDEVKNEFGGWVDIAFAPVPTLADAAANFYCGVTKINATQARLGFTPGGGTPDGTCEVWVHASSAGN